MSGRIGGVIPDQARAATSAEAGRPVLTDRARAKVNLSLDILGRRPDGYHELESLVAFADVADVLTLDPAAPFGMTVSGPFAAALVGHDNLAMRALQLAHGADPLLRLGALHLEKHLPVAAGIGGGSADAAAALRLVGALNPERAASIDWMTLAARLGADVPVCVVSALSTMTGVGDKVTPLAPLRAPLPALLVNPMTDVPPNKTAAIFKALAAAPLRSQLRPAKSWPSDWDGLLAALSAASNDLQGPASEVMPAVTHVLSALRALPGVRLTRLSGAGPTCFALLDTAAEAERARVTLAGQHPEWWIVATALS